MAGVEDVTHLIRLSDAFYRHYERMDALHAEADYDAVPRAAKGV